MLESISDFDDPRFKANVRTFKTIADYEQDLEQLKNETDCKLSLEEVEQIWFKYARIIPFPTIPVPKSVFNGLPFFRVRSDVNHFMENIYTKAPFTYPPIRVCKRNLRASPKNSSVFYCSPSVKTSVGESKLAKRRIAYIGEWKLNIATDDLLIMPYIDYDSPFGSGFPRFASLTESRFDETAIKCGVDIKQHLKALVKLSAYAFTLKTDEYALSSWLSNFAFRYAGCQGIAYPSFITNQTSMNFAFLPSLANNFSLEKVYKVISTPKHSNETMSIHLLEVGERIDDSINWRKKTLADAEWLEKHL